MQLRVTVGSFPKCNSRTRVRMKQNQLALVRRFNRPITRTIRALDDNYLSRGRSLGPSRLLWEIGPARCEVKLLLARLGLESGYFSRQLRRLEADRLVITAPDGGDVPVGYCREARTRSGRQSDFIRARAIKVANVWRKLAATEKNDRSSTMCGRIFAATDDCTELSATRGIAACAAKLK